MIYPIFLYKKIVGVMYMEWTIIDRYFKDHPDFLIQHHLTSYDDFVQNRIPQILREKNPITISITKNGEYFLEERSFSIKDLELHLKEIARDDIDSQINIRADTDTEFGNVSHILSLAQKLGLKNVGFITEPR